MYATYTSLQAGLSYTDYLNIRINIHIYGITDKKTHISRSTFYQSNKKYADVADTALQKSL